MSSETYTVGKEVVSYCGKCKLKLGHTIVSLKADGSIAKVKCNTCGDMHGYRLAPGTRKKSVGRKKAEVVPLADLWAKGMQNIDDCTPYSIRKTFEEGEGISHVKFGDGFVEQVLDGGKVSVVFKNEIKTLVHGK